MIARDDAALIRLLKQHEIQHVVIGGWAVSAHGYIRTTRDIDAGVLLLSGRRRRGGLVSDPVTKEDYDW